MPKPTAKQPPLLLTVREAAETLRCSPATIYRLISTGALESVDIGQGRAKTRVPRAAVEKFVADRTRTVPEPRAAS